MTGLNHTGIVDPSIFGRPIWKTFAKARAKTWSQSVAFYMNSHVKGDLWKGELPVQRNVIVIGA